MSWANTALKLERLLMIVRRVNMYVVDKLEELHKNGKLVDEELDEAAKEALSQLAIKGAVDVLIHYGLTSH